MTKRILAFFVFFNALCFSSFSQDEEPTIKSECPESENTKAVKLFGKYLDKKKYDYNERMKHLTACLEEDPDYPAANFEMARQLLIISKNKGQTNYKQTEPYYLKVIDQCPNYHSDPYYYLGIIAWEANDYDKCTIYMQQYLDFKSDDEKKFNKDFTLFQVDAQKLIKLSKTKKELADMMKNPVPFDPQIVPGLSSATSEYLPIISPDNQLAFYTRQVKPNSKNFVESDKFLELFMMSKRTGEGKWDSGNKMAPPFNKGSNEGGACVTIDNKHLYFTICKDEGGPQVNCDIWTSDFVNNEWTELKKLGGEKVNDKSRWDSQPTISADGKTIYFTSDRSGGYGGVDIWKTEKDATGEWGAPINLGPTINTNGDEKAPFMHSDSQTLYFSSGPGLADQKGGWPGFGGFDIFFSKADDNGKWTTPKNIGYPINNKSDEVGFFVSTDGKTAYFASDNPMQTKGKTLGGYDIYSFELHKGARPEKVVFFEGELKNDKGEVMKDVNVQIKDVVTNKTIDAMVDTVSGKFRGVIVDKGNDILIKVEKEGVSFSSQLITPKDSVPNPIKPTLKVKLESKKIEKGQTYTINNIYYETGSADLKGKSKVVIKEFAEFLKKNPQLKIEIESHTDDVGNDNDNMNLSKDRAFTVYEMLIELGVNKSQVVSFNGYGETKPVAPNTSEQGRAKNRRTDFVIISQ
jgi:outer membrane protein OmpA-like peptidoglycan-associated protein